MNMEIPKTTFSKKELPAKNINKEAIIAKKRLEIGHVVDANGKGIDEEIKDIVVAFNVAGFPTSQSCQGHYGEEGGLGAPWVRIESPNEPAERFYNQNNIFGRVAEKYELSADDLRRGNNMDAYWEAMREASAQGETSEYQKWSQKNQELLQKAQKLLDEFYKNREANEKARLQIEEFGDTFQIHNGGEDYDVVSENISEDEKLAQKSRLETYRREMKEFANFILDKHFNVQT